MGDVFRVPVQIGGSGNTEATAIRQILHGTVAIDLPSTGANGGVASASASVPGLTGQFNVLLMPQAWLVSENVSIAAALCSTDTITVTSTNAGSAAVNPTSQTFQYFAWR